MGKFFGEIRGSFEEQFSGNGGQKNDAKVAKATREKGRSDIENYTHIEAGVARFEYTFGERNEPEDKAIMCRHTGSHKKIPENSPASGNIWHTLFCPAQTRAVFFSCSRKTPTPAMTSRLIIHDTDELNLILERAFAAISNPLEAQQSVWNTLEKALSEAYSLGCAKTVFCIDTPPQNVCAPA